jgi:hypothetical protein
VTLNTTAACVKDNLPCRVCKGREFGLPGTNHTRDWRPRRRQRRRGTSQRPQSPRDKRELIRTWGGESDDYRRGKRLRFGFFRTKFDFWAKKVWFVIRTNRRPFEGAMYVIRTNIGLGGRRSGSCISRALNYVALPSIPIYPLSCSYNEPLCRNTIFHQRLVWKSVPRRLSPIP